MGRGLDGFSFGLVRFSSLVGAGAVPHGFGGHSEGVTPLPIPNREVKPLSADGTWWATAWESRSPPVIQFAGRPAGRPVCVVLRAIVKRRRREHCRCEITAGVSVPV